MQVKKAVILAAGRGTRFLPYTKAVCKELISVVDRPAIYLVVEEVIKAGIEDICIVISPEKEQIKKYFSPDAQLEEFLIAKGKIKEYELVKKLSQTAQFTYVYQPFANGSGGALDVARNFCGGSPVAVLNADDAIFNAEGDTATKQLCDCFEKFGKTVLGVQGVEEKEISKYASCNVQQTLCDKTHLICDVVEKPKTKEQIKSLLAPLGRYVIDGDFFAYLDATPVSANGEWTFTDALQLQAQKKGILAYEFDGKRYDLGDKLGYLKAVVEYAMRDSQLGEAFSQYIKQISKDN